MSRLFIIENNMVKPNPETLLIEPFCSIWSRDSSPDKFLALNQLAYIEFMVSQEKSNPFKGYSPEERHAKLCATLFSNLSYTPDTLVKKGMELLEEFQTEASPSYTLLIHALKAKDRLQDFLSTANLDERTRNGSMVLKPKDIASALLDITEIAQRLNALSKAVEEDLFTQARTKANKVISKFADPNFV